jgi:hypothetical protein
MIVFDHWSENLRCPNCRKTGTARLSQADGWNAHGVPEGFKVVGCNFTALHATARWTHRDGQDLFQRTVARILEQPDQYRATMMIATTMNAATSERTRSSVFDLGFGAASGGGMAYVGGCSSPANQPTASDFMGSNAIMICST